MWLRVYRDLALLPHPGSRMESGAQKFLDKGLWNELVKEGFEAPSDPG